ncbi:MAG: outer membrane beta-barrel protein [Hyphomonadaceae bacterium]
MRNLLKTAAAAALMAGVASKAEATEGWYGRAEVGYSVDGEFTSFGSSDAYEDDWMGDAAFGYAFQNGFRTEGELAYRSNELFGDDIEVTSLMGNLYYDFNRDGRFRPYVGAGVGVGHIEFFGEDDTGFAWQVMAGIGIPLSERLTLDLGYRHFEMGEAELELDGPTDVEYEQDAVTLGIRWQFSTPPAPVVAPPPPPPVVMPPPPVCPASEFTVYFEWDRSNLNQAALDTIDAAVTRARQCNIGNVLVVGHTDSSGPSTYNVGLSQRRASVVRDALVARGIAESVISSEFRGETDLARATGDNVREPLNRRTAVTIRFR